VLAAGGGGAWVVAVAVVLALAVGAGAGLVVGRSENASVVPWDMKPLLALNSHSPLSASKAPSIEPWHDTVFTAPPPGDAGVWNENFPVRVT